MSAYNRPILLARMPNEGQVYLIEEKIIIKEILNIPIIF